MEKKYFTSKKIITNEDIKELLENNTLNESEIKAALIEARNINHYYYLQEVKKNNELKKVTSDSEIIKVKQKAKRLKANKKETNEIDIDFYLDQIRECTNIDEVINILPKKNIDNFEMIINAILMHLIRECVEIEKFIVKENLTKEEKKDFQEEIRSKQTLIHKIAEYRNQPIIEENKKHKNNIIYLTSPSDNIYAQSDLKDISKEFYDSFLELFNSIIDGTFKNVKYFTNHNKIGKLYEVKNFKTRIIFDRINKNTYIIISVFIKKTDKDLRYFEQIINRSSKYFGIKEILKEAAKNQIYIDKNKEITEEILGDLKRKGR